MLISSAPGGGTLSGASGNLRRSRRLSSTRGLKKISSNETGIGKPTDLKTGTPINWEVNERISLSSGSSTGLEVRATTKKGIEFGENRRKTIDNSSNSTARLEERKESKSLNRTVLELMNVSGFQDEANKRVRGSSAIEIDENSDRNVIKSDSKYEIGVPSRNTLARKTKQRRQTPSGTLKSQKSGKKDEASSRANGHERFSSEVRIDKANDSISKRLELIHELNQKILANYERFQQRSKRSHAKDGKDGKDGKDSAKSSLTKDRAQDKDSRAKEQHLYVEVKRKNRLETAGQKSHGDKFPLKDRGEVSQKRSQKDLDSKENFTLAVKPDFYRLLRENKSSASKIENSLETKTDVSNLSADEKRRDSRRESPQKKPGGESQESNSIFYTDETPCDTNTKQVLLSKKDAQKSKANSVFYTNEDSRSEVEQIRLRTSNDDCLETSQLYPEVRNPTYIIETQIRSDDSTNKKQQQKCDAIVQRSIEDAILESLDETIERFDERADRSPIDSSNSKSDSFSSDSIRSSSPDKKESKDSKDSKDSGVHETTLDSSWDSGVGVDVGTGSGWVRIHTGIESSLVYLTLDTTVKDVCRDMLLGEDLSLFIKYGGEPGRRLSTQEKPLELQDSFLKKLGYQETSRRARLGVDPELRHLIAFHVGPASPLPDLTGYSRCGSALVLKGLVFPQWKRRPVAVVGSRLFLYPACPESRPEWMELGGGGGAVCYAPSRLGKLVLRVTGFPRITQRYHQSQHQEDSHHRETRHLYLGFHHPWDRDLWKCWLKQATQLPACTKELDLSKSGLSRIPESATAFSSIEEIFLGQNQLDDTLSNLALLHRFPKLRMVHMENNDLTKIPRELLELKGLTYLDLSDNNVEIIPAEINLLTNLKELVLDRNAIEDIPDEVGELKNLQNLSIVGNLLRHLPNFFNMRALALADVLSKNEHGKNCKDEKNNQNNLNKVNLRNNQLKGNIILGNYGNLTHLDVSENSIEKLDISALQELRSVRCARNLLTELTLCGRNLVSLIAGNNKLKKLTVEPVPTNLEHLDVSYNDLDALPEWTPDLPVLRALFASHNTLTALPDRLLSHPSRLEVLHLPHNRLQALPPPRRPLNIVHLTLQDNALTVLPPSFFANTEKMKVLNLSNNRLSELPYCTESNKNRHGTHTLEKLYLTANCLTDRALDTLAKFKALRILHIAYNILDTLPESCITSWSDLEELVLSGNRLQYLPDNVANLRHLRVLRVHSNRLLTCPTFGKTTSLKVLDLAHNQLDRVNLATLVPPTLQFLDISCNTRLHVDPRQFQVYRSQRPISLVDVSGQNRSSLPSHPHQQDAIIAEKGTEQPWRLGFSETAGYREKLYISQVRMPSFCNVEGLFGIFDGGSNQEAPSTLQEMIPRLLLEERTVRETSKEYLKYTLLSAHRELKDKGQKYGIDATLLHIIRIPSTVSYPKTPTKYSLKVASSGEARAVLCRAAGPLTLAPPKKVRVKNQLGNAAMFPLVVPDPTFEEVTLEEDDEFIVVANRRLWEVLSVQEAVREARAEASPVLAAKRLQDLAQAYGADDNLSIIVVRLTGSRPGDLDQLMRELRHAVGKNRGQNEGTCSCPCCVPPVAHKPPGPCCCHTNEGYYLNGVVKNIINRSNKPHNGSARYFKNARVHENESPPYRDDRSSPSGQSDQASDSTFKSRHPSSRVWSESAASRATSKARQSVLMQENASTRKGSGCLPAQEDAASERSGALSEEQFRCWEYMLEQNTQLLFDKELDTLTRAPLRRGQSRSTPQLAGNLPFLSKRFGSARSFNPSLPRPPVVRFGSGRRLLNGGPNAAYFGSLQRLMPYNLEYDFAVIQERGALDSLEQDASRMQQYWGVATTEL